MGWAGERYLPAGGPTGLGGYCCYLAFTLTGAGGTLGMDSPYCPVWTHAGVCSEPGSWAPLRPARFPSLMLSDWEGLLS